MAKMTPMMEQYMSIKNQYKFCLLFYRLGDFYELFFEDAVIASKELEITLTGKSCGMEERAPMCGVPFHSADGYIAKLVEKGYKVAICEQVEDPKQAKGIVKRDVVRIITPGTVLDTNSLDEDKNNYIMCISGHKTGFGLACCDLSTGEFITTELSKDSFNSVIDEIARFLPSEIIINDEIQDKKPYLENIFKSAVEVYYGWNFDYQNASITLCNHFKTINLNGYGLENSERAVCAAGALMAYLNETQKNNLSHITGIKKYSAGKYMLLDISSRRNLELTQTIRDKSKKGSLLWVLDKTKTAMGARLLRKWLEQPLIEVNEIQKRLDAVEQLKNKTFERQELNELLNSVYDIERIMTKVVYGSCNGRDMLALKNSFRYLPDIKNILCQIDNTYINEISSGLDCLEDMYNMLDISIDEDAPVTIKEGGVIKKGYNSQLDIYKEAREMGGVWLTDMETKEKEATGIKNLKIGYNNVFHYYIEVTNSNLSLVPDHYIRKQTLANCERYITPQLKELENTLLESEEKMLELEYKLFVAIRQDISNNVERIQATANALALIDVLQSFALVAERNNYCKPIIDDSGDISIVEGRHPVVEQLSQNVFIPNDTVLNTTEDRLAIITGPNMAGKSTYMRQVALIVLMAQIGCFVPAQSAKIGVVDRIFTRVGASDDLATGQSTFMIEMAEVANILNNATKNSLLILDEIGRGTSTYDGLSIAWAVLEYIADPLVIGARTLFATHYHELTELEDRIEGVRNYSVSVKEQGDEVIFLRKIVRGGADKSFGVYVARLAGVPDRVLKRADEILEVLGEYDQRADMEITQNKMYKKHPQDKGAYVFLEEDTNATAFEEERLGVLKELEGLNVNEMSPMEALQTLFDLQKRLNG